MMYSEGEKILKSQYKRTMKCSEASRLFKLIWKAEPTTEQKKTT